MEYVYLSRHACVIPTYNDGENLSSVLFFPTLGKRLFKVLVIFAFPVLFSESLLLCPKATSQLSVLEKNWDLFLHTHTQNMSFLYAFN